MRLDPFYLIVDDVAWLERLLPHGLRLAQLRLKDRSADAVLRQVAAARALCERFGALLVVNDHWAAAIACGCRAVHLGHGDLDGADLGRIRAAGLRIGLSTHDEAELDRALACAPDYVALGPIFATTLKALPFPPQGLGRIAAWKRRVGDLPLVAIGGMTPERARAALDAGADSVAVATDVLGHPDPEARVREWLAATRG